MFAEQITARGIGRNQHRDKFTSRAVVDGDLTRQIEAGQIVVAHHDQISIGRCDVSKRRNALRPEIVQVANLRFRYRVASEHDILRWFIRRNDRDGEVFGERIATRVGDLDRHAMRRSRFKIEFGGVGNHDLIALNRKASVGVVGQTVGECVAPVRIGRAQRANCLAKGQVVHINHALISSISVVARCGNRNPLAIRDDVCSKAVEIV